MDYSLLYSESTKRLKSSKIRELFKMTNVPGIISMAGGMPDSENLPFEKVKNIINKWDFDKARVGLQYGTTRGLPPLLSLISERMVKKKKISMDKQEVIITTGSQQALSLISKLFLNEGDVIIVEIPSFIGAIASFYSFLGKLQGVKIDDDGMIIADLQEKIQECKKSGKKIKGMYIIPNFNNPSGIALSQERRGKILEISNTYGIPIIEDDPYGDLFFYGEENEYLPIKSLEGAENVIYLGTFSKVLSPGIRVGWVVGEGAFIEKLELQKQSFDACTSTLSQLIAYDYMKSGFIDSYIEKMRPIYKEKRDAMLDALETYMPEEIRWTQPKGGLFVWVILPESLNSETVFRAAIKQKVAFITGDAFLPEDSANNYIRLTYGDLPVTRIVQGIRILADVLKTML